MEIINGRRGVGRRSSLGDHNPREYPLFSPVLDWEERREDQQLEFRFFSSSSSSSAAHGNCVEMIAADEIFSNGRMLPCDLDFAKNAGNKNISMAVRRPNPHASSPPPPPVPPVPAAAAAAAMALNRSSSSSSTAGGNAIRKKGTAVVATTTCSSHWKEIFHRLRNPGRPTSSSSSRCYESSGSLSSDMDAFPSSTGSSSRRLLLLPDHHGEDFSLPLIDSKAAKKKDKSPKHHHKQGMDHHDKSARMMRVSSFDSRSSSRVYPGGGADHQTSRRSFSKDHPRRSLSSLLYDQQYQHHRHQSITPVLNMPVCMGDSFVVSASSSSGKLSKIHSTTSRAKRR